MAALGLVAYDGSGSSSDEDEDEQCISGGVKLSSDVENGKQSTTAKNSSNQMATTKIVSGSSSFVKPSVMFSKFIDDEDEDVHDPNSLENKFDDNDDGQLASGASTIWSKILPQPKKQGSEDVEKNDDVEIGPIPPKKTYGDEEVPQPPKPSSIASLAATKFKGKVRISIPFLNSLEEDESMQVGEERRIMQPAQKGSGLFAVLPQPKNSFGLKDKDSNLFIKSKSTSIKQSAAQEGTSNTKINSEAKQQPSTSMSRLIPDAVKNKLKRPAPSKLDEIRAKFSKTGPISTTSKTKDSDSEDDDSGDFFSLDSTETIDPEALEKLKLPMQNFDNIPTPEVAAEEPMDVEEERYPSASSSSHSEDLIKFIQPKRGKKEDIQIIDINADDLRPDNTEWLKNMTDEAQAPARKSKGLGGMVKRKHQITYLAFEAKAREQELKNQWAQNRANKMATKNKYGF